MGAKLKFVLGLHCHQPVGNFDHVIEQAYQDSYLPFLEVLERFPRVRVALHYSGPLLEWLSEHHPEFFNLIRSLAAGGQLEIMGGGHYEPILPVVPHADCLGQLLYMKDYIQHQFGRPVRGAWLTERIWEPHLPAALAEAGLEYVTVDDYHFRAAGLDPEKLHGYYLSEDEGRTVGIFPISERLRYMIPFYRVEEVIDFFKSKAETLPDGAVIVLADDGEKFGLWPGMKDWVYGHHWLEKFFEALMQNDQWLEVTTFSSLLDQTPATGRVYLPTASYFEMGEWTLPAELGESYHQLRTELQRSGQLDRCVAFLRGGFWRNFLVKYPEANQMHKRMLQVSRLVHREFGDGPFRFGRLPEAVRQLWMAQCNCAYWHGIFGGLYLPHLRHAVYQCLIRAEKLALSRKKMGADWVKAEKEDFDCDGEEEVMLAGPRLNLFVKPARGGAIYELDHKDSEFNLADTLARRREAYHSQMQQGPGQKDAEGEDHATIHDRKFDLEIDSKAFICDPYPRHLLREHFFARAPENASELAENLLEDLGDFADQPWTYSLRQGKDKVSLLLERNGSVRCGNGGPVGVGLVKKLSLAAGESRVKAEYRITNLSERSLDAFFGVSFNLTVLGPGDPRVGLALADGSSLSLEEGALLGKLGELTVFNRREKVDFCLRFSRPATVIQYPVSTISQSEKGADLIYQATCLVPSWPLSLSPSSTTVLKLELAVVSSSRKN